MLEVWRRVSKFEPAYTNLSSEIVWNVLAEKKKKTNAKCVRIILWMRVRAVYGNP